MGVRRSSPWRRHVAVAALGALACTSSQTPPSPVARSMPVLEVEGLEDRALLLLLSDRKSYEPLAVARALDGGEELRRQAALALARIGDPRGGPALESLLADPSPAVRRSAAFALGELGEGGDGGNRAGAAALEGALNDPDRETGWLAVEALAKLGVPLGSVVTRLIEGPSDELLPRLVPSLFRFEGEAVVRWAAQGLEHGDPAVRAMAAYALARNPLREGVPHLRELASDADPWIRGLAARGLGRVGDREDFGGLRRLLDDPEAGPIIQALRAARRLVSDGKAAPPEDWQPRLLELFADPRPGVRLTAIEASSAWLLDEEIGAALGLFAESGVRRERELALLALAEGRDPRAASWALDFAAESDPVLRVRAAEAAGFLRAGGVLDRLAGDEHPGVRRSALEARLEVEPVSQAAERVRSALEDPDPTVRSAALAWAEDNPVLGMEALLAAMAVTWRDRAVDARVAGVAALEARAAAAPAERGAIVAALEVLGRDGEYLVRRRAARALESLDRERPAVGAVRGDKALGVYREVVQRTSRPRVAELVTERGTVRLELACPEAPLTCLNFLQLATQGFYDGLTFHRVVPDFVVQAGDPRGDGRGGPGYAIRDEMNTLRYRRGAVGMALSGPDTGGSQFFVTLSPQPHLDGGYTVFGRVVAGDEVLDRIVQGDHIVRIVEVVGR